MIRSFTPSSATSLCPAIDIVPRRIGAKQFRPRGVGVRVVRHQFVNRVPAADVAPSEFIASQPGHVVRMFDHAEIHRNVFAERKHLSQFCRKIRVRESRQARDQRGGFRLVFPHRVKHRLGLPEEHPRVPEVMAGLQKLLRGFQSGFSRKLATCSASNPPASSAFGKLDVAICRVRPPRLDSQHADLALFRRFERCSTNRR